MHEIVGMKCERCGEPRQGDNYHGLMVCSCKGKWQDELKDIVKRVYWNNGYNDDSGLIKIESIITSLLKQQREIIQQEAFMTGRVYASLGEKESPIKIQEILEKNCDNALKRNAPEPEGVN